MYLILSKRLKKYGTILTTYNNKKILVVSHDAGAAELISSWLKKKKISFSGSISGPAKKIFSRKKLHYNKKNLKKAVRESDLVVTGTGWSSKNEINSLIEAKKYKKKIICFLDHWKNYKLRFKLGKKYLYPDEIWVSDTYAKKLSKKIFKNIKIKLIKNYYWEFLGKQKKIKNLKKKNFIIATTNFNAAKRLFKEKINMTDETFIIKVMHYIKKKHKNKKIYLKIHPSEKKKKYIKILKKNKFRGVKIYKNIDPINLLKNCETLIACETNLLATAKLLGVKTYNVFLNDKSARVVPNKYFDNYLRL